MTLWTKFKIALIGIAFILMFAQSFITYNLNNKVAGLEQTQLKLQQQITQVETNYSFLSGVYKSSNEAFEKYVEGSKATNDIAVGLEKQFSSLSAKEKESAKVSQQKSGIAPEVARVDNPTPSEWRKLLDDTYCQTNPSSADCNTSVPAN